MTTASRFRVSTVVASLATLSMLTAAVSGCAVRVEDAAPAPTASIAPQATRATPAPASDSGTARLRPMCGRENYP